MSRSIYVNSKVTSKNVNSKVTGKNVNSKVTFSRLNVSKKAPSGAPLGKLPNHEPTSDSKASGDSRDLRYKRQSIVSRLLPDSRTANCLKHVVSDKVTILKSKEFGKCHYSGLMTCGSVWTCPVCAAKISEKRKIELKSAVDEHTLSGGSVLLVTFTHSHKREESLQSLLDRQSKATQWFYRHRTYKELKQRYMKRGRVRALEVNYGHANGWHPHMHELWFLDVNLHDYSIIRSEIFNLWLKACSRFDLGLPSEKHGVDVRGGEDAANYVSKFGTEDAWGIESELTKANIKKGRNGSRSPFQLLDDYEEGDKQSAALFVEYVKAFKGKRQLIWSRGLKAQFELDDLTDKEVADLKDDKAEIVISISYPDWELIRRPRRVRSSISSLPGNDSRLLVLQLAENGGSAAVNMFLKGLKTPPKTI